MYSRRITRYYADCGRGFWKKSDCERHEVKCKCWSNPKFKTCNTCIFSEKIHDSNGMESDPQYLQTWIELKCNNPNFIYDKHFKAAHINAPDLCINCPVWKAKKQINKQKTYADGK